MITVANQPTPSIRQQLTRGLQTSIKHWIEVRDSLNRARVVIETASNLGTSFPNVPDQALAAAMEQHPYWQQGPENYLDMAFSLQSAYALLK